MSKRSAARKQPTFHEQLDAALASAPEAAPEPVDHLAALADAMQPSAPDLLRDIPAENRDEARRLMRQVSRGEPAPAPARAAAKPEPERTPAEAMRAMRRAFEVRARLVRNAGKWPIVGPGVPMYVGGHGRIDAPVHERVDERGNVTHTGGFLPAARILRDFRIEPGTHWLDPVFCEQFERAGLRSHELVTEVELHELPEREAIEHARTCPCLRALQRALEDEQRDRVRAALTDRITRLSPPIQRSNAT